MDVGIAGFLQEQVVEDGCGAPAFLRAKGRPQGLAHDAPGSAFIAKREAPSTRGCDLARGVARHCYRSRTGNRNDADAVVVGSGERDGDVISNYHVAAPQDLAKHLLFIGDAAGESKAATLEFD